ncbi:hypothetical protein OSTOST_01126 [Ostertagia ostertagi]
MSEESWPVKDASNLREASFDYEVEAHTFTEQTNYPQRDITFGISAAIANTEVEQTRESSHCKTNQILNNITQRYWIVCKRILKYCVVWYKHNTALYKYPDMGYLRGFLGTFIPHPSPWMSGVRERMVGTIKRSLQKMTGSHKLNDELLQTTLCEKCHQLKAFKCDW